MLLDGVTTTAFQPSFHKAELALPPSFKAGEVEDLASAQPAGAGPVDTDLVKLAAGVNVPREARRSSASHLRRTARRAKAAFKLLTTTTTTTSSGDDITLVQPGGHAVPLPLPLPLIRELLCLLDINDVYRTPSNARRQPVRPCPFAAQELYDRLLLAGSRAQWSQALPRRAPLPLLLLHGGDGGDGDGRGEKKGGTARRRARHVVTDAELRGLLWPVVAEVRACLEHVESFCGLLRAARGWVPGLAGVRESVFRLMGYWPRDVRGDDPAGAFDLPSDLAMLLYPQICLDRDEMVENLEGIVLGPGWDRLARLEGYAGWMREGVEGIVSGSREQ